MEHTVSKTISIKIWNTLTLVEMVQDVTLAGRRCPICRATVIGSGWSEKVHTFDISMCEDCADRMEV